MPRKKKKDEIEKENEEAELEETGEEPESEEFKDWKEIDENRFTEFLEQTEIKAPVLEKIAVASESRATDLEQDLSEIPNLEEDKKENEFSYLPKTEKEEPKYITSGEEIEKTTAPSRIDVTTLGKEPNILPKEVGFSPSPHANIGESSNIEKYTSPDRFDITKIGKQDSFKKQEVKYEPSKKY